jgi:rhamnosyltransferase
VISVLIPVKNGGDDLRRCLDGVRRQRVSADVELIVVDSGSSDGSVELARSYDAIVFEISPETFDHGATRNYAASKARGEYLAFTSQDAYPVDEHWLARLVTPLAQDQVAGVYGRQLAHDHASPPEVYFLDFLYGPRSRVQAVGGEGDGISMSTTLFSNANAAMRREVWARYPFAEDLIMSEDQEWSRRVLLDGYRLVYDADAAVRHSHDYTLGAAFKRFFDSGVSASRSYLGGEEAGGELRRRALDYARGELGWLVRTGRARWIPYAVLYEATKFAGLQLGMRHERIPDRIKPRLSALGNYWVR